VCMCVCVCVCVCICSCVCVTAKRSDDVGEKSEGGEADEGTLLNVSGVCHGHGGASKTPRGTNLGNAVKARHGGDVSVVSHQQLKVSRCLLCC
jgi:hypothetical protein